MLRPLILKTVFTDIVFLTGRSSTVIRMGAAACGRAGSSLPMDETGTAGDGRVLMARVVPLLQVVVLDDLDPIAGYVPAGSIAGCLGP